MRSPAEIRRVVEWGLRIALLAGLALALQRSLQPPAASIRGLRTGIAGAEQVLAEATRSPDVGAVLLSIDSTASHAVRAWMRALARAGVDVAWSGNPTALAVQVERAREPEARLRVLVATDSGTAIALADSAGPLDTLRAGARGVLLETATLVGAVRASAGRHHASAAVPAPRSPRPVLVLGRLGWEARFTAAALQEAGWTVRSRQPVAPGVTVADAGVLPIDTARYAVVVALDSTAGDHAGALVRFVAQGGGVVLVGEANQLDGVGALAAARAGARQPGRILLDADSVTPADLPLHALTAPRSDAVQLEAVPGGVAAAIRRAGMGRVVSVGFDETWRWRMLGGASGPAAHRDWWSRTVGLVAPDDAPVAPTPDAAPTAALVDDLGARVASLGPAGADSTSPGEPLPLLLLAAIAVALLAETASRRFRGAR